MQLTSDLQRSWKEGGLNIVISRSLRKLVRPVCRAGSLVFIECDLLKLKPERREVAGIVVREATAADVELFEDRKTFFERLQAGHRCFMGIEEATGKLTNYRWVCTSSAYIPELQRHLKMKPWEAYVYDLNTLPEFRRRGIDAFTRHWIYTHLRDSGFRKVYAYIHGDNQPSLKASRHLLEPIGRVWYIQPRGCRPMMIGGSKRGLPELSGVAELTRARSAKKSAA
jgi:ribosomal protein S18 acetylase RimI-like enzyme